MCRQDGGSMQYEGRYLVGDLFDGTLPAGIEAPGQELPVTPVVHPKLQELLLAGSSGCGFGLTCKPALTSCTKLWHEVSPLFQALNFESPSFQPVRDKYHPVMKSQNLLNAALPCPDVNRFISDCLDKMTDLY